VNGVPVVAATDASISSGFPGLGAFQTYNANSANLQWKNWMASPGYVSLQRPQTWSQLQTFSPGIAIGAETASASPRGPFNVFSPGALTSTWTGESWTLDKAITVTRVQAQAKTAAFKTRLIFFAVVAATFHLPRIARAGARHTPKLSF
jgi:hypothetical protein